MEQQKTRQTIQYPSADATKQHGENQQNTEGRLTQRGERAFQVARQNSWLTNPLVITSAEGYQQQQQKQQQQQQQQQQHQQQHQQQQQHQRHQKHQKHQQHQQQHVGSLPISPSVLRNNPLRVAQDSWSFDPSNLSSTHVVSPEAPVSYPNTSPGYSQGAASWSSESHAQNPRPNSDLVNASAPFWVNMEQDLSSLPRELYEDAIQSLHSHLTASQNRALSSSLALPHSTHPRLSTPPNHRNSPPALHHSTPSSISLDGSLLRSPHIIPLPPYCVPSPESCVTPYAHYSKIDPSPNPLAAHPPYNPRVPSTSRSVRSSYNPLSAAVLFKNPYDISSHNSRTSLPSNTSNTCASNLQPPPNTKTTPHNLAHDPLISGDSASSSYHKSAPYNPSVASSSTFQSPNELHHVGPVDSQSALTPPYEEVTRLTKAMQDTTDIDEHAFENAAQTPTTRLSTILPNLSQANLAAFAPSPSLVVRIKRPRDTASNPSSPALSPKKKKSNKNNEATAYLP